MALLAKQVHYLSATTPTLPRNSVAERGHLIATAAQKVNSNLGAPATSPRSLASSWIWRAALVLPQARWVLEARLRRLARGAFEIGAAAGNRTRIVSMARRHSAVEPQPQKIERAGSAVCTPGP